MLSDNRHHPSRNWRIRVAIVGVNIGISGGPRLDRIDSLHCSEVSVASPARGSAMLALFMGI